MKKKSFAYQKEVFAAVGALLLVLLFMHIPFFQGVADSFDRSVFQSQKVPPSKDIVLVTLDNETLNNKDFKRFQDISRADYAKVLQNIMIADPVVVGVDVFFFNESENTEDDLMLASVLRNHDNIVLASEFDYETSTFLPPSDLLGAKEYQKGYITLTSRSHSQDENVDQVAFFGQSKGQEPFVIKLLRLSRGDYQTKSLWKAGYNWYTIVSLTKKTIIPLEKNGAININFFGSVGTYESVSLYDVWSGTVPASFFKDRIVLVGASATDIHDNYFTPTARTEPMPGVEIHAHALQTLQDEVFLQYYSPVQQWLWIVLGAIVLLAAILLFSWWGAFLVLTALSGGFYYLSTVLYRHGVVASWFWPVLAFIILAGTVYIVRFVLEEKQKRFLQQSFGRYVSPDVVQKLLDQPGDVALKGEQRQLALWFSDIVNFTTKSEQLSPEKVVHILNVYLEKVTPLIHRSGGTIDKFLGDGIMAFWGAPLDVEKSSLRACETALLHQKAVEDVNETLVLQSLPPLAVRIGLHSDLVNVGNVGTSDRLEYTALGDGVNLASRLEGINKAYGTNILVSESIVHEAEESIFVRELDTIQVKGKDLAITVFELMALKGEQTSEQKIRKEAYEKGLDAYRNQDWNEAKTWFSVHKEDSASRTMLSRIQVLQAQTLPKDWNGVFIFETK